MADVDVFDVGPQETSSLEQLVRDVVLRGGDDEGDSARIILKPTPQQRADLDAVKDLTQAKSQTQVFMDALDEYKASLRLGSSALGCITLLDAKLSALEDGLTEDRAMFERFTSILNGYQRSFEMFTILHEAQSRDGGAS